MRKINLYKPIIKLVITHIGVLLVMTIFLSQFANVFVGTVFRNRLDETEALAFEYTFNALPFRSGETVSNVTGEKMAVLNTTFNTQTYYLYSEEFASNEIKNIGTLKQDGQTFLVLLSSEEVQDGKKYLIYGKFVNFYKCGTRQQVSVLLVEDYHEFGLLDEIASTNRFFISQVTIGLFVLTIATALSLLGTILWFVAEIDKVRSQR